MATPQLGQRGSFFAHCTHFSLLVKCGPVYILDYNNLCTHHFSPPGTLNSPQCAAGWRTPCTPSAPIPFASSKSASAPTYPQASSPHALRDPIAPTSSTPP